MVLSLLLIQRNLHVAYVQHEFVLQFRYVVAYHTYEHKRKKSNFDRNQLKFFTQHKYTYMYQENCKNGNSLVFNFGKFWLLTHHISRRVVAVED